MNTRCSPSVPTRLYALFLKLRPLQSGTLMSFSGELVHGAFLHWLKNVAPDVATWLHDGNKRRLFTCSSLQFPLPVQRKLEVERTNVHLPLDPRVERLVRQSEILGADRLPLRFERGGKVELSRIEEHWTPSAA